MPSIAVIGPGAIGGIVAAWLAQNPANAVALCARSPLDTLVIDTPQGPITARPDVILDPARARPVDWVLVATKAYDVAGAALWLPGLTTAGTRIAILQNGVEHIERFAPYAAPETLVPVVVDIPAERTGPGRVWQRREGTLVVADTPNGRDFVHLFAGAGIAVSTDPDLRSRVWRKLAINCAGAVSALTLQPAGVSRRPPIAAIMRDLVRECVAVGRAEGAMLADDLTDEVVTGYQNSPPDSLNSLHADRAAGRPMELDARNGVIVRLGARHGIPTPVNQMIVALLEAAAGVT
jgi:2-dehydropantoate 2-reductase